MYSIFDYGAMIADTARIDAVIRALRRVVTSDTVVVDIGTGTGIFALLACQLGARRVYAIEPDDAIELAREAAAANGYADRIECIQALSTDVTLPERADVIVSDIGGVLPWLQHHLIAIVDARTRLLAAGGTLIPRRDTLWMAIVEAEELYRRSDEPWAARPYGVDLASARRLVVNLWWQGPVTADQLLTPVERPLSVDYIALTVPHLTVNTEWSVSRAGTGHGFCAGIERVLVDGVGFSNSPDCADRLPPDSIYRPAFFPWPSPVSLARGDVVRIEVRAVLAGEDYVWNWKSEVRDGVAGTLKARFDQSTFYGLPLSPARLHKRSADYVPVLNEEGSATTLALELMRRSTPLGEIAHLLVEQFPTRFADAHRALTYVSDLSQRYTQ